MQNEKNKELKNKLEETINNIKANSKDPHFADSLISDLLSIKGQLDHEPTLVHLPIDKIADSFEGDTFSMNLMKDGTAVYHVKGGMDIVVKPNLSSLNQTIASFIESSHKFDELSDEDKEAFETELQASCYVMNVPMIAFSDIDFMFDTASGVIKFLSETFEEEMGKPLQDETPEENEQFRSATMAIENLKSEMAKEEPNA